MAEEQTIHREQRKATIQSDNTELLQTASLKVAAAVVSFLLALTFFAALAHEAFGGDEATFDHLVFRYFDRVVPDSFYDAIRFFTFFGKPDFLIPVYIVLVTYFILTRQKGYALEFGILGATSTGLLFGLKKVFQRSRPDLPIFEHLQGYSFPSGHALLTFILSSFLIYWLWNSKAPTWWKGTGAVLLVLFSICQGLSRIILRVHYATDVIAGFCLGYAWIFVSLYLQKLWRAYRLKNKVRE